MREKDIENAILAFLSSINIIAWQNATMGVYDPKRRCYRKSHNRYHRKGIPDILGFLPGGIFMGIEVKKPKLKDASGKVISTKTYLNTDQKKFLKNAHEHGCCVFVARSVEDVITTLKAWGVSSVCHVSDSVH